jgi:hypothetical protein
MEVERPKVPEYFVPLDGSSIRIHKLIDDYQPIPGSICKREGVRINISPTMQLEDSTAGEGFSEVPEDTDARYIEIKNGYIAEII